VQRFVGLEFVRALFITWTLSSKPKLNWIRLSLWISAYLAQTRIDDSLHIITFRSYNLSCYLKLSVIIDLYFISASKLGVVRDSSGKLRWCTRSLYQTFIYVYVFLRWTPVYSQSGLHRLELYIIESLLGEVSAVVVWEEYIHTGWFENYTLQMVEPPEYFIEVSLIEFILTMFSACSW
jgi:hypothetical protein